MLGDARLGILLLIAAAVLNLAAVLGPWARPVVESAFYVALLGAVAITGLGALAVRAPSAWREWRRPGAVPGTGGGRHPESTLLELAVPPDSPFPTAAELAGVLRRAGYRVVEARSRARSGPTFTLHAVRRGWSRLVAQGTHAALVLIVLGAGLSTAGGEEDVFSLLPGEQAPLGGPGSGDTASVRLESFEAEFGADGRPTRLDTRATFLRDGAPARTETLQVNRPGAFDGYLVHGWTYGPAVRLRVVSLAGRPLLDGAVPLDELRDGHSAGAIELPTAGGSLGLVLADAAANELLVGFVEGSRLRDAAVLRPGERVRLGAVEVALDGFTSYVTFLSRRDPGAPLVFTGSGLLAVGLVAALWLPRRRVTLTASDGRVLRLSIRGERFDDVRPELARVRRHLAAALPLEPVVADAPPTAPALRR